MWNSDSLSVAPPTINYFVPQWTAGMYFHLMMHVFLHVQQKVLITAEGLRFWY